MAHDDFDQEPVPGLPEAPPEGERILWQGRPDWRALARESLMIRWVAGYFAALALWRVLAMSGELGVWEAARTATPFAVMGLVACGLIAGFAWAQARASLYTITNRRVAMRIGAALTVTLNLPYQWIGSADLRPGPRGTGSIALSLMGRTRLSYLVCWPHVRPWHMKRTQPALRCIPEPDKVAALLGDLAEKRIAEVALRPGLRHAAAVAAE